MTKSQRSKFYRLLKAAKPNFAWYLDRYDRIRGRSSSSVENYCPMTAIAKVKTNKYYSVDNAKLSRHKVGLSHSECADIINAADEGRDKGGRAVSFYNINLRKQMLKILNLKG